MFRESTAMVNLQSRVFAKNSEKQMQPKIRNSRVETHYIFRSTSFSIEKS